MVRSVALLALAAACLHATTDAQQACTSVAKAVQYSGVSIESQASNLSPTQCRDRCASNSECRAYNSYVTTSGRVCALFSVVDVASIKDAPGNMDWSAGRCGTNLPTIKGDFPGNDLSNALASDPTQCSYKCEATAGCQAYSWNSFNGGTCWMKTTRPVQPAQPYDGSVVSGEVFRCQPTKGKDIIGNDLPPASNIADWRDCCGICRRVNSCIASSWTSFNGGTCWLKNKADSAVNVDNAWNVFLK